MKSHFNSNVKQNRVLVIGIDGAELSLIEKWKNELPTIRRLMENGAYGRLKSTYPPESCPAWCSFYTGKNPGKIGVFGFKQKKENEYDEELVNRSFVKSQALWALLSEAGKKSIVINVPITYPPQKIDGILVTGMGTPSNKINYCYPPSIKPELDSVCDGYIIEPEIANLFSHEPRNKDIFLGRIKECIMKRTKAMIYLLNKYKWDFAIVVYMMADRASHFFWHYMDTEHLGYEGKNTKYKNAIKAVYKWVDNGIKSLLRQIDTNTTVILMSDHGFKALHGEFVTNTWLKEIGYLRHRDKNSAFPLKKYLIKFFLPFFHKLGFISPLLRIISLNKIRNFVPLGSTVFNSNIDWKHTKAFCCGHTGSTIWINLKDREPMGIVSLEYYENIRREIIEKLKKLKIKGKRIVNEVFKREDIFWGKYTSNGPDLFFLPKNGWGTLPTIDKRLFYDFGDHPMWGGFHSLEGMWIMSGAKIKKIIKKCSITDLAPTILYLLDVKIPKDMDGTVLADCIKIKKEKRYTEEKNDEEETIALSEKEQYLLMKKLKELGYLS